MTHQNAPSRTGRAVLLGAAVLFLAGCASVSERETSQDAAEARQDRLEEQVGLTDHEGVDAADNETDPATAPVPDSVEQALSAPLLTSPLDLRAEEPRFDLAVDDVRAREFFHGLVDDTPYNVIVHPDVEGRISLSLRDVSVPETMDAVREVYGYEYRESDVGFLVLPAESESRIFQLHYLNVHREGSSGSQITSGQVTEALEDGDRQESPLGSRINTSSDANVWEEVENAVERLLEGEDNASVVISPHSGVMVVRALPGTMRQVEEFLDTVQESLVRQVILEARIIEVTLSDEYQTGINWGAVGTSGGQRVFGAQTGGGNVFQEGRSGTQGSSFDFGSDDPFGVDDGQLTADAFGGVFSMGVGRGGFSAFIEALEGQGDVQVLSSPRVSTVNNQKAVIKVGNDEFFVTDVTTQTRTVGTTTETQASDIDLNPFFSGIALDVTPYVDDGDWVTLHVQPSVSEVRDQIKEINLGDDDLVLPLASSDIRQSDSIVRAQSGEMVVIGGLIEEREESEEFGVPYLQNIPLLGALFRHTRQETRKTELVILLRPQIVATETWANEIEDFSDRIRDSRGLSP